MPFRDIKAYSKYVINQIASSGLTNEWYKVHYQLKNRDKGSVSARGIVLVDGALLSFTEDISIQDNQIIREYYSYRFESTNCTFRYDKDPDAVVPFLHAECHLHANGLETPRYITHETSLDEIFGFIKACFYVSR
jgi:hypothetical protein